MKQLSDDGGKVGKKKNLSRLERVDLREYWEREDSDFTPWLASDENIEILGDALGLELEVERTEANVGPFRADILCRRPGSDELILIENQLERTDHSHLGQLFTYAAGLDAVTVIWIASRFTDEHRAAMDWLNRITHDGFNFFALEVELWKIADSPPAPRFNVVSKPNDWAKAVTEHAKGGGGELTEGQQLQVEYWSAFGDYLETEGNPYKSPKPYPSNWVGYGLGRTGFGLLAFVNMRDGRVATSVWLSGPDAKAHFGLLERQRDEIENELGFAPEWKPKPGKKECQIIVRHPGDTRDRTTWQALHEWTLRHMTALDTAFRPRVKDLNAAEWQEGVDED